MKPSLFLATAVAALLLRASPGAADPPRLLQHPSLSASEIAFDYAGAIWSVPRAGGEARLIAAGQGRNSRPIFSPDGRLIAFTGTLDGNTDVYVAPAAGGAPRRLTWHPGEDVAVGWTPDGKKVLFTSERASPRDLEQLYAIPVDGGPAERQPVPTVDDAALSPDGARLAYTPFSQWQPAWKHYRGGQTSRIWIADLATSKIQKIPRENSNDRNPVWVGDRVYFLSDRDGPVGLYSFDPQTNKVAVAVANPRGFDIGSASAGPGGVVYEQFGALRLYDPTTSEVTTVPVSIHAELPQVRPHYETLKPDQILSAKITATGKRVLFEAHGEILSAPVEKGDIRNLTQSPAVADRDPSPSPDGLQLAYFSDQSGEYQLHVRSADGLGPVRTFELGDPPSFFYHLVWSPDGKRISYYDKRLILWCLELTRGAKPAKVDVDAFDSPAFSPDQAWSPDSRYLAYVKQLPNHLHAAFLYDAASGATHQLTDGLSDVRHPRFDRSGDYLFFAASTSTGLGAGWLDMSSLGRPQASSVYALVLRGETPSPVAPESDEETAAAVKEEPPAKPKGPSPVKPVRIDFENLDQRIVALPIPASNFADLETGGAGVVFTTAGPVAVADGDEDRFGAPQTLAKFDLKTRKSVVFDTEVDPGSLAVAADGSRVLYAKKGAWYVRPAGEPGKEEPVGKEIKIDLASLQVWVDPRAEWSQIYSEAWRIERDFLYDPNLQGLNLKAADRTYRPFLEGLGAREDLNVLLREMTGHIGIGHTFISGGDLPKEDPAKVGLLGADFEPVSGRYKIVRILRGENWNPKLSAPLSQPGVAVKEGEFLLAVNGRQIRTDAEVYKNFEGLAGKRTVITVAATADGAAAREVTVTPVDSETSLRLRDWMEANRRRVDQLSGGRLAYVYLPDTAEGGFTNFNRYYFAQVGKQGAIIDERFNHGGDIADYIVDQLKRTPQMINATREGGETVEPAEAIFGPKVMIINQMSGSGGDALPWLFKKNGIGPLVGVRTWGGLVGIGGYPRLIDGGQITAPRWAIYGTKGEWEVENIGIAPDVEVEQDPALMRSGGDPQLEAAVAVALEALAKAPAPKFPRPAYPDRRPVLPDTP